MNRRQRPPGPTSYLLGLDTVARITRDPVTFYERMRRTYGDVVYMKLGPFHDYTLFHPDAIRELLTTKAKSFVRMRRQMAVFRQWNGDSVLIVEGDDWVRQRRVLQPAFSPKRFEAYGRVIVRTAEQFFRDRIPAGGAEGVFDRMMFELTTAVICRTMFGSDLGARLEEVRDAVATLSRTAYEEMLRPFSLPAWWPLPKIRRKKRAIATLDGLVRQFIRERRAGGEDTGDLLSMMLFATDEENPGRGLTDEEVRDNCVTIFLAGHDTTAVALGWLGWFLASRPDCAARARAEVAAQIGNRPAEYGDLSRLTFLDQMVNETLRHRPPAIGVFGRQAVEEVELAGYELPADALVHALSYTVHHDERWFPEPEKFDPDRFAPDRAAQIPPNAFFPFGMGPRICLGAHFARMEMLLVAATLVQRYDCSPAPGQREPEPVVDVSLRPKGGVRLRFVPRS